MKKLLALAMALSVGSVLAETHSSNVKSARRSWGHHKTSMGTGASMSDSTRNMIEFNADSVLGGLLNMGRSKVKGERADNGANWDLRLNYAYSLPSVPRLQIGGRLNYFKQDAVAGRGDAEDYGVQVGAIWNFFSDLQNSPYVSGYVGLGWANTYGGDNRGKDELMTSTLSVGKRFSLERFGIGHLVYTPELALRSENSTTGSVIEYRQDFQIRFLQFSVFF